MSRPRTPERVRGHPTFRATGLTCGHCARAVREELMRPRTACSPPRSTSSAAVRPSSPVVTERDLADDEVAAALAEAGDYVLVRA